MAFVTRIVASTAAACVAAFAANASAQQTIKLTVAAGSPVTVTPAKMTKEVFIPEVNKRLAASGQNVKIEWTEAYNQTLAKFTEVFESVEEGVAHVGVLLKVFEESKLPLEQYAASIPFGITDPAVMQKAEQRIRSKVPEMDGHYTKYNQVVLAHAPSESMQMFTKFPLTKVEDLKGRKIGGSGALAHVLRGTDAVIVTASMAASYTDISNGLYDGYVISAGLALPYKTYQAAPYLTQLDFGCTATSALSINKKTWDGLPTPVKEIFHQAAQKWADEYVASERVRYKSAMDAMAKANVKVSKFPDAERRKWAAKMPNIAKEWAAAVDRQGLPGTRVLTAYMEEMRAAGVTPIRDWTK